MAKLFLAFTLIPLLELALLIKIGQYIGTFYTIFLVMITGGIGVVLARSQGFMVLNQLRFDLGEGRVPGNALLDGLFILIGSVLLITPGLMTDVIGFSLLLPFSRLPLREYIKRKLLQLIEQGRVNVYFGKL